MDDGSITYAKVDEIIGKTGKNTHLTQAPLCHSVSTSALIIPLFKVQGLI